MEFGLSDVPATNELYACLLQEAVLQEVLCHFQFIALTGNLHHRYFIKTKRGYYGLANPEANGRGHYHCCSRFLQLMVFTA